MFEPMPHRLKQPLPSLMIAQKIYQASAGSQGLFIFQQTRPLTPLLLITRPMPVVTGVTWLAPIVQIFPL